MLIRVLSYVPLAACRRNREEAERLGEQEADGDSRAIRQRDTITSRQIKQISYREYLTFPSNSKHKYTRLNLNLEFRTQGLI